MCNLYLYVKQYMRFKMENNLLIFLFLYIYECAYCNMYCSANIIFRDVFIYPYIKLYLKKSIIVDLSASEFHICMSSDQV